MGTSTKKLLIIAIIFSCILFGYGFSYARVDDGGGATTGSSTTSSGGAPSASTEPVSTGGLQIDSGGGVPVVTEEKSPYDNNFFTSLLFKDSSGNEICKDVPNSGALKCWIDAAFVFSQNALLVLSVAAVIVAGIMYMTSAGDPKRIAMAKKILFGAFTAVGIVVLGRFFLTYVIGV